MKTEEEIKNKLAVWEIKPTNTYSEGAAAALRWALSSIDRPKFGCPKCGKGITKVQPTSGYSKTFIDPVSGEEVFPENYNDYEACADSWYECSSCRHVMDKEWKIWYGQERPTDGDEEGSN